MQEQKKKPLFQEKKDQKKMLGDEKKPKMLGGAGCGGMKDDNKPQA